MSLFNLPLCNRMGSKNLNFSVALILAISVLHLHAELVFAQSGSRYIVPTQPNKQSPPVAQETTKVEKIVKSDQQWRKMLTAEEYEVTRLKGTEDPFTGKLLKNKKDGVYVCKCCGHALFDSKHKYESQTGWPSYFSPKNSIAVSEIADLSHQMVRTEVVCRRCDAHLGHVFNDGPRPTGMRYCMNSVSLNFVEREKWDQQQKKLAEEKAKKSEANQAVPKSQKGDGKPGKDTKATKSK